MTLVECVGGCQGKRVGGNKLLLRMHKLIDPVLNVPEYNGISSMLQSQNITNTTNSFSYSLYTRNVSPLSICSAFCVTVDPQLSVTPPAPPILVTLT